MPAALLARDRILSEARDVFLEHGAPGVTMRGLAARIGVTPMALYRHFDNRDQLLAAIVTQGHATFLHYLNRALSESTPALRLLSAGRQYLAFALEHPRSYAVMFMEHVPRKDDRVTPPAWEEVATFQFLIDRIRECRVAGVLQTGEPEDVALTIWAHVHGLVSLYLAGKLLLDRTAFESVYLHSTAAVLRGFGWAATA